MRTVDPIDEPFTAKLTKSSDHDASGRLEAEQRPQIVPDACHRPSAVKDGQEHRSGQW